MRILVTGGREYADRAEVERKLRFAPPWAVIVHGAAPGADSLCASVWEEWGGEVDPHPADWTGPCRESCRPGHRRLRPDGSTICPAAGVYRNSEMLESGVDFYIAFPGGRGTADMVEKARHAGLKPLI